MTGTENFDLQAPGEHENIAATLSRILPTTTVALSQIPGLDQIQHLAVPKGFVIKTIDNEELLEHPRRTSAVATLNDTDSFTAYVRDHTSPATAVWCRFDPQTFSLSFTAVIDEHQPGVANWRKHQAQFTPALSAEWKVWKANNGQQKGQAEFAEFIEANEGDITSAEGLPTSLQMMTMATEFVSRQDMMLKSTVRLQGGGVNLTYVSDADKGTLEQMKVFEKFAIGIPTFWSGPAYRIDARLKYRLGTSQAAGTVKFFYELIRADRVHEAAAKDMIAKVQAGIGIVPLRMGACT